MKYLQEWQPTYAPGTYRTYANPSIGLHGLITAKSMNQDFAALMEGRLFPVLGVTSTYINVPDTKMADYAQGYTEKGEPIRMASAVLSSEAYGVKTTATDMIHFVEANMGMIKLNVELQRAGSCCLRFCEIWKCCPRRASIEAFPCECQRTR